MIGRHQSELETPALGIDLTVLEARIKRLAAQVRDSGKQWFPNAEWHLLPEIAQLQSKCGAVGIALQSPALIHRFLPVGVSTFHLSQPPISPEQLHQLVQASESSRIRTVCDHYAQAEEISRVASEHGRRIPVLIELNVGLNRSGVRPGLDARDLARGMSRLPGIEVIGLSADLGTLPVEFSVGLKRAQSAAGMLAELREQMLRDGVSCDVISVAAEGDLQHVLDCDVVTEVRTGNHFTLDNGKAEEPSGGSPVMKILASIFSRSKLERAVLDVGGSRFPASERDQSQMQVHQTSFQRSLPDVSIAEIDWESTTLELGPLSRDLVIGDKVEVIPGNGPLALRLFDRVYAVRDGIVEEIWNV